MTSSSSVNLVVDEITDFKAKPSDDSLGFGTQFTDRMLLREHKDGAWQQGRIKKFENFSLSPATTVFHYAQEIFEGLKAFRQDNGRIVMFRPDENAKRFNRSAIRMVMPPLEDDYFVPSINELVNLERDWVPKSRGTALYIRPTMIGTEAALGVHPSDSYYFYTILSPVGSYFAGGFKPTKIMVEDTYVRAALGGTGEAKAGGNYAGSLLAAKKAKEQGYAQVLWLDAKERKYIEEVGAMNIAFVENGEVITPMLSGSILPGITRKSVLQIAKDIGIKMTETEITIDRIIEGIKSGTVTEVFGIGTAASIAPVGEIKFKDEVFVLNNNEVGPTTQRFYDELVGIQYGSIEDKHGWIHVVE
ncbi:MAG: branched-chain amino acid aminotransferase [Candidatus Heimdallarchaeota archaeon]|nr:branched-chain amino acid aminotransferase [Candidatus Heimdallarchaeota archaeon]